MFRLKKITINISIIVLLISPTFLFSGKVEGLSESSSALAEAPNFEHQLVRINTAINYTRLSNDIMKNMPISEDAKWVDKTVATMDSSMVSHTLALDEVRNDAYFSTALLTNVILRRPVPHISPTIIRLYYIASVIYKNKSNGHPKFHIPDFNEFPDIKDIKTYAKFKENPKVQLIDVEAKNANLYENVEAAILSLLPDNLQERAELALDEKNIALNDYQDSMANVAVLESWLNDNKHLYNPDRKDKQRALLLSKEKNNILEENFNNKKDIYLAILDKAALEIESNFDTDKIPLAKKIDKLLELVDDAAINSISLFTAAGIGIYKGYSEVDKEIKAILKAQALSSLVGNQKIYLIERYKRMLVGTVTAIPNVSIGTYYVLADRSTISTYKNVVGAVLEGAEARDAAIEQTQEDTQVNKAQEAAEASSTETK